MPNLIEQQDLLKGLPDARLAQLLQQPVGDIPPFLVAAEAQRRQAIRQQFGGAGPKESVVDTLTKQLVPQKINAPMNMPPPMPPPMPQVAQAGIAGLQQPQEGMAAGGMVQRYAGGTLVAPTVNSMAEDLTGGASGGYYDEPLTFWDKVLRGAGRTMDVIGAPTSTGWSMFGDGTQMPSNSEYFGIDPQSIQENRNKVRDAAAAKQLGEYNTMNRLDTEAAMRRSAMPKVKTPQELAEEARIKKTYQQYADSRKPEETPTEEEDARRKQLEDLYKNQEPSDWEKAQRWFAMSEQFLDPSKTTMQSLAGAGRAFAEASGDMASAARQREFEMKKAMLEYDIGKDKEDRDIAANRAALQRDAYKFYAEMGSGNVKAATELMDNIARKKNDYIKATYPPDPATGEVKVNPDDPTIKAFDTQLNQLETMITQALGTQKSAMLGYGASTGTDPSFEMYTPGGIVRVGR